MMTPLGQYMQFYDGCFNNIRSFEKIQLQSTPKICLKPSHTIILRYPDNKTKKSCDIGSLKGIKVQRRESSNCKLCCQRIWFSTGGGACFGLPGVCLDQRSNCNRYVLSAPAQHRIAGREQQCADQCQRRTALCFFVVVGLRNVKFCETNFSKLTSLY